MNRHQPPVTLYEEAPNIEQPRATLVVRELLDAASDRLDLLDLRYPSQPHQSEELAVRDLAAAVDELRAIVETQSGQIAVLTALLRVDR